MSGIQVCLRIKPNGSPFKSKPITFIDSDKKSKIMFNSHKKGTGSKTFVFNSVHAGSGNQEDVYGNFKFDLIQSVIDGVRLNYLVHILFNGIWTD